MNNIYMIGNTHFDPVWLWKWDEAMASIHSTFRSALDRMNEDPTFVYSFATPPVFEWIRQTDPAMFEEIRRRVSEGRWELCEGWYLQPDCFSAAGESYARQGLYGQRYLLDTFGRYADTVFNIDSFGHNAATPQLLAKSHIAYYCMCRPESWHVPLPSPYFYWQSKDGSRVKAFRAGQFSEIYTKDLPANIEQAETALRTADCDEMMVYGVTNHGGAPTKQAIADIHRLNGEKPYDIRCATVTQYFEAQGEPSHTVEGELITGDFGPYTNLHEIKRRNRVAEYAALDAEKAALIARELLDRPYPADTLASCWRDILFHQFHDILGGACIKEAYVDAFNGLGRATLSAEEITQFSLQSVTRRIQTPGTNADTEWNLVVWNLNDRPYDGYIEAEVQWLHEFPAYSGGIVVEDAAGRQYPCQVILSRSVIAGFRSRFVFRATVPAMGYRSFRVIKTNEPAALIDSRDAHTVETDVLSVTFDPTTGYLGRVTDKRTGRTWEHLLRPVCLADEGDTWCFNIDGYGDALGAWAPESIRVTESGPLRTTVKAVHTWRQSRLTLYYTFYRDTDYFDVRYVVNWNEAHTVLKLACKTGGDRLSVAAPFTVEQRGDTVADQPMGEWLSMQGETGGVALMPDNLFSYTKQGDTVLLSVLRSCIYGDLRLEPLDEDADYPIMEQGISEGRVRVMLHSGDWREANVPAAATAFQHPPLVIDEANHGGDLPAEHSFFTVDADHVAVSAIKQCETDDSIIVRLCEYGGIADAVSLTMFDRTYTVAVTPYEIKTLKLTADSCREVAITED